MMNPGIVPLIPDDVQGDGRWMSQHNHHLAETKEREPDVVLIGDSLIHQLQLRPVWNELFEPLHCLNFGIPGDCTQHVLWRIQNGELDNINPKVVVVLVGTNNYENSPEEISDGIKEIVTVTKNRLPNAYVVVVVEYAFTSIGLPKLKIDLLYSLKPLFLYGRFHSSYSSYGGKSSQNIADGFKI